MFHVGKLVLPKQRAVTRMHFDEATAMPAGLAASPQLSKQEKDNAAKDRCGYKQSVVEDHAVVLTKAFASGGQRDKTC
jgi:hypothetical protein